MTNQTALAIVERKQKELHQNIATSRQALKLAECPNSQLDKSAIANFLDFLTKKYTILEEIRQDIEAAQAAVLPAGVQEIDNLGTLIEWIVQGHETLPAHIRPIVDELVSVHNRLVHESENEATLARVQAVKA